jgi:hypothetical protein
MADEFILKSNIGDDFLREQKLLMFTMLFSSIMLGYGSQAVEYACKKYAY